MVLHDANSKPIFGRKLVYEPTVVTTIDKSTAIPIPFHVSASGAIGGADSIYDITVDGEYMVITWTGVGSDPALYSLNTGQYVYINNTALVSGNTGKFIIAETAQTLYGVGEIPSGYMKVKNPNAAEALGVTIGDSLGTFALYDSLPQRGSRVLVKLFADAGTELHIYTGPNEYIDTYGLSVNVEDKVVEIPCEGTEDLYYMTETSGGKFAFWTI